MKEYTVSIFRLYKRNKYIYTYISKTSTSSKYHYHNGGDNPSREGLHINKHGIIWI